MRVLITFHSAETQANELTVTAVGGEVLQTFTIAPIVVAEIPKTSLEILRQNPAVRAVEPDLPDAIHADGGVDLVTDYVMAPDVTWSPDWGLVYVRAPAAKARGIIGTGVKVGIIDSGIDYRHPELAANYDGGFDFVNNDPDPLDDNNHGTHTAGTVASRTLGVAPGARLYGLKILSATGSGSWTNAIAAYEWCVRNGMQVTCNSYSGTEGSVALEAALEACVRAGILMVVSAGNSGPGAVPRYPAAYAGAIAVSALDFATEKIASFSSRGPKVEVCAPGVRIRSPIRDGGYGDFSGTSMSCPHVVGGIALALGAGVPAAQIRQRLAAACRDFGAPGRDPDYGWGVLDVVALATGEAPQVPEPPAPLPPGPFVPALVEFDASASHDPDGGAIVAYQWTFGDGLTGSGVKPSHRYLSPGRYEVTLTVWDSAETSGKLTRPLTVLPAPKAVVTITRDPPSGAVPVQITYDGSKSTPEGKIKSYEWEYWVDHKPGNPFRFSGPILSELYSVHKTHPISLKITDDQGQTAQWSSSAPTAPGTPGTPPPPEPPAPPVPPAPGDRPPVASFTIKAG
jgi:subtilisin